MGGDGGGEWVRFQCHGGSRNHLSFSILGELHLSIHHRGEEWGGAKVAYVFIEAWAVQAFFIDSSIHSLISWFVGQFSTSTDSLSGVVYRNRKQFDSMWENMV